MGDFTKLHYKTYILKEIQLHQREYYHDPIRDGYHLIFDEADIRKFEVLIKGPENTPYEAGFFHFSGIIPDTYPFKHTCSIFKQITVFYLYLFLPVGQPFIADLRKIISV